MYVRLWSNRLAGEQQKSEMLKQMASHTSELRNRAERLKGRDAEAVTAAQQVWQGGHPCGVA